jgi:hypothetical protein
MAPALRQRTQSVASAAEQVVARMDSYSQEAHTESIKAGRQRALAKRAARKARAEAAAARLHNAS